MRGTEGRTHPAPVAATVMLPYRLCRPSCCRTAARAHQTDWPSNCSRGIKLGHKADTYHCTWLPFSLCCKTCMHHWHRFVNVRSHQAASKHQL